MRSAGEQAVAALEGVFAELFAKADPTSVSTRPAASATESQLDARLDDELAKLE